MGTTMETEYFSDLVIMLTKTAGYLTADHQLWIELNKLHCIQKMCEGMLMYYDKQLCFLLKSLYQSVTSLQSHFVTKAYVDLAKQFSIELQESGSVPILSSSKQLENILIHTQAFAKLVIKVFVYSKGTFNYLNQRLKASHILPDLLTTVSITAKVSILLRELLLQIFAIYHRILLWKDKREKGDWNLPKTVGFPEHLEAYLKINESDFLRPLPIPQEIISFLAFSPQNFSEEEIQDDDNSVIIEQISTKEAIDTEVIVLSDDTDDETQQLTQQPKSIEFPDHSKAYLKINESASLRPLLQLREKIPSLTSSPQNLSEGKVKDDDNSIIIEEIPAKEATNIEVIVLSDGTDDEAAQLTQQQKLLLDIIKEVKTVKDLREVWSSIKKDFVQLLPKVLTPQKIVVIDKLFVQLKYKVLQKKRYNRRQAKRKKAVEAVVQKTGFEFAKHLGLIEKKKNERKKKKKSLKVKRRKEKKYLEKSGSCTGHEENRKLMNYVC